MIYVRGRAGGTELTGTIYEPGEEPPSFRGAPDEGAPYTWVCDEFYEVDSGGSAQSVAGREIRIAFESPLPRGFDSREAALDAAKEHVRTQFRRLDVPADAVDVSVEEGAASGDDPAEREADR